MSLRYRPTLTTFAILAVSLAQTIGAQVVPITWSMHVPGGVVHVGKPFTAFVRAQIPFSWHLYSTTQPPGGPMATTFTASAASFTGRGKVSAREPDRAFDAIAGLKTETYSDSVTFSVPVVASRTGKQTLEVRIRYQSCTDRFCAPQQNKVVKSLITVEPALTGKE